MRHIHPIVIFIITAGCVNLHETMTIASNNPSGEVHIEFSGPMQFAEVDIDSITILRSKDVETLHITGVEAGERSIHVRASDKNRVGGIDYSETFNIQPNGRHEVTLQSPSFTTGYYLTIGGSVAGAALLSILIFNN